MAINFNELRELLGAIAQTDITELTLKSEDFELTVRKSAPIIGTSSTSTSVGTVPSPATTPAPISQPQPQPQPLAPPISEVPEVSPSSPADKKWSPITSPMVGTFYRAPAPDELPFVEVGTRIRSGDTVCIIEAMKLMNEIEAEFSGQVMEIAVANGEPVEYGQTLMWVNPD